MTILKVGDGGIDAALGRSSRTGRGETSEGGANSRVPFGQDFTPATLGKKLGEDAVLGWLLDTASRGERAAFTSAVAETCLGHVKTDESRRDMAGHVVTAMRAYKLIETPAPGQIHLTAVGELLLNAPSEERHLLFARHIVTMCNGQLFLDAVRRYTLRGETPDLEDLSIELGEHATSKNISTLRAWLSRSSVVTATGAYRINEEEAERLLGAGVASLYGLERAVVEFLLAARILQQQQGSESLDAVVVATMTMERADGVRIRRKSLDKFVQGLEQRGLVKSATALAGRGGSRTAFTLADQGSHLSEEQLRELLAQSQAGFALSELSPLGDVVAALDQGHAQKLGLWGEQLAVHICLILGLRVRSWRKRAPHSEIDLIAERLQGLAYQRWFVQVKNTADGIDGDQVDREIGASVGLGVTHILFVAPRAKLTPQAQAQIRLKSRVTPLHIYVLTDEMLAEKRAEPILVHLVRQARQQEADKRAEAESRERGD